MIGKPLGIKFVGQEVIAGWQAAGIESQVAYQAILRELRQRIERGDRGVYSMRDENPRPRLRQWQPLGQWDRVPPVGPGEEVAPPDPRPAKRISDETSTVTANARS